jgi:hypothetical protein
VCQGAVSETSDDALMALRALPCPTTGSSSEGPLPVWRRPKFRGHNPVRVLGRLVQFGHDFIGSGVDLPIGTAERCQPRLQRPIDFPDFVATRRTTASFSGCQFRACIPDSRARGFVVVSPILQRLGFSTS